MINFMIRNDPYYGIDDDLQGFSNGYLNSLFSSGSVFLEESDEFMPGSI